MTAAWMFSAGLILMMIVGVYVLQALLWAGLGAMKVLALAAQALLVAVMAIIRPSSVVEAWRRSQPG